MSRELSHRVDGVSVGRRAENTDPLDQAMEQIRQALRGLRFGEVAIVVQDGVVIQIERTERTRLRRPTA
jgi:hypothetical protein